MKPRTLVLGFLAMAVVGVGGLLVHHAQGVAGTYATFQPANYAWEVGSGLRICPTEAPTGPATAIKPSGGTLSLAADSEGCFALNPSVAGAWQVSWGVAGPATRSVSFVMGGPSAVDWAWWVELVFWAVVLVGSMIMGWWFIVAFAIGGSIHLISRAWPFDEHWIIPLLLFGLVAEWAADKFRLGREKKRDTVL